MILAHTGHLKTLHFQNYDWPQKFGFQLVALEIKLRAPFILKVTDWCWSVPSTPSGCQPTAPIKRYLYVRGCLPCLRLKLRIKNALGIHHRHYIVLKSKSQFKNGAITLMRPLIKKNLSGGFYNEWNFALFCISRTVLRYFQRSRWRWWASYRQMCLYNHVSTS